MNRRRSTSRGSVSGHEFVPSAKQKGHRRLAPSYVYYLRFPFFRTLLSAATNQTLPLSPYSLRAIAQCSGLLKVLCIDHVYFLLVQSVNRSIDLAHGPLNFLRHS